MKSSFTFIFIFLFNYDLSFALPRFAVSNSASCIVCHVNPTGSGMRNSHGNDVVALEELPLERWLDKGDDNWDGYITDQLQIGGDIRMQGIQYNDTDNTQKTSFFPMQADIYSNLILNKNASIFTKVGVKGPGTISMEYWGLINNLPKKAWLRVGRTFPNYGLRVDDHTSFIRGGNFGKTKVGLKSDLNNDGIMENLSEGLLFGPYLSPPAIFEFGIPMITNLEWTASMSTSLVNQQSQELNNFTTQITHIGSIGDAIQYRTSFSYMQEDDLKLLGVSGGASFGDFTWTFAVDQAENWISDATSLAVYDELAWKLCQGVQIIGKYDAFDPRTEWNDGAVTRITLGAKIYPLNIMEIKLQVRINEVDMENATQKDPEYLIQTHLYF